jgi:glutamine amidotransferase-like uncharacterized protein
MKGRLRKAARDPIFNHYRRAFLSGSILYPRIAVYSGSGASHSWIWFADLFERSGLFDVGFIDESTVKDAGLSGFDAFFVGGGDTYEMASSLGREGAGAIEGFVREGGFYFGSCAGAYLVLSGVDLEPFAPFNLIRGDMLNVMEAPPEPRCLEHKYKSAYGDRWVFHPVYGEVKLAPQNINAPLFGGPVISEAVPDEVLAEYSGLTDRAAYLWPRLDAEGFVKGRSAVLLSGQGGGTVVASGPHLEHPLYPAANALAADLLRVHCSERPRMMMKPSSSYISTDDGTPLLLEMKRQVSNARIVGFGLERMPVSWKLGQKVWEPEKICMFLDCVWGRLPYLFEHGGLIGHDGELERLASGYADVTRVSKSLKIKVESGQDSLAEASKLLLSLKELTARFLSLYFRLRLERSSAVIEPSSGVESLWLEE